MNDPYRTLGVKPSASPQQIRKAYLKLSKKHHPDAGGSTQAFQEIEAAYRILRDAETRAYWDRTGEAPPQQGNDNAELYMLLGNTLEKAIDTMENVTASDLIAQMNRLLVQELKTLERNIEPYIRNQQRVATVIRRIKSKGEENVLRAILQTKADGLDHTIKEANKNKALIVRATEFLKDYEYDSDKLLGDMQQHIGPASFSYQFTQFGPRP